MYKLFAMDMDGTLLNSSREISEKNKKVLTDAKKQNCKIVIASGRPVEGLLRYAQCLNIVEPNQYLICFNGAVVYELNPLKVKVCNSLSGADVRHLAKISHDFGILSHAFSATRGLLVETENPWTDIERTYNEIEQHFTDFNETEDEEQFYKFMFCGTKEQLDYVEKNINELREKYTVVRSMFCFLEFLNKKSSKGFALEELCKVINLPLEQTVAFGDAQNDEHMLEVAGLGVAMGNAIDDLKLKANIITKTNDDDGVAIVIENILHQQKNIEANQQI